MQNIYHFHGFHLAGYDYCVVRALVIPWDYGVLLLAILNILHCVLVIAIIQTLHLVILGGGMITYILHGGDAWGNAWRQPMESPLDGILYVNVNIINGCQEDEEVEENGNLDGLDGAE